MRRDGKGWYAGTFTNAQSKKIGEWRPARLRRLRKERT